MQGRKEEKILTFGECG